MTSRFGARSLSMISAAAAGALLLVSCESSPQPDPQQSPEETAGGGMETAQPSAPSPQGDQHSHDQMRTALEKTIDDAEISDTDDWWASLRDLNRELQKLRVSPTDCKPFVTASALPVPSGALAAIAEHEPRQTAIYSFENTEEAQGYAQQEADGAEKCDEHTVTREVEDSEVIAETTVDEVEVRSGAEDALATSNVMEAEDQTQHSVTVLLRHGPTVVGTSETLEESVDEDQAEELAVELEAEAAAALSALTGDEIVVPESESEEDPDDDDAGDDDGGDGGNDGDGGDGGDGGG